MSWLLMTWAPVQAGNRASKTERHPQWWESWPERWAVTSGVALAVQLLAVLSLLFFAPVFIIAQAQVFRQRPYHVECTGSLPNSEVKRRRARLVLGWGTAREGLRVLSAFAIAVSNVDMRD